MARNILNDEGEVMPFTNGTASVITSGTLVLAGDHVGVALTDIAASGGTGNLAMDCVVTYAKNTGSNTGGAQGATAYWDNTAKKLTAVSTSNKAVGYFWATCADGDSTAIVKLMG